jgi:hypothetical protein
MRFLSFSNKKKNSGKKMRTWSAERSPWPTGAKTRQNLQIFSGVSFQGGDIGSRGNHPDFFFLQKDVAHLATYACKTKFKLEFFVWYLT